MESIKSCLKRFEMTAKFAKFTENHHHDLAGLSKSLSFTECVAMDLKFCNSNILLHLVDHATSVLKVIAIEKLGNFDT